MIVVGLVVGIVGTFKRLREESNWVVISISNPIREKAQASERGWNEKQQIEQNKIHLKEN